MNIEQLLLIIILMYILFNAYNVTERMENKKDKEKDKEKEDSNNWWIWLIVIGVIVIFVVIIIGYYINKETKTISSESGMHSFDNSNEVFERSMGEYPTANDLVGKRRYNCGEECNGLVGSEWQACYSHCL